MGAYLTGFFRLIVWVVLGSLFLSLAACQSKTDTLEVVQGGSTDDPAPGFANVTPGSEEDFILNVGRRIYFAKGSSALDGVAIESLDLQSQWLNKYPNWYIKIQGFSDDPGSGSSNVRLSDQRAKAVMDYLASHGVSPQRMWTKGYGKQRLVATNCKNNSLCQSVNRRVILNLRSSFGDTGPQATAG